MCIEITIINLVYGDCWDIGLILGLGIRGWDKDIEIWDWNLELRLGIENWDWGLVSTDWKCV